MYCTRNVTKDLIWVGGNDRRLSVFEGVYEVPKGVSYNSYLLIDEKTVVFDTVDHAVSEQFFENILHSLGERSLDYIVVQHMEPDHSGTLASLLQKYPSAQVVCNIKTRAMIEQFLGYAIEGVIVGEGDTLNTGKHEFVFVMAPMVHWPEVMVTYDKTDKVLFSADAFGTFGALNGALFADEVDFERDYMDEARRYYCNIVGKYGVQVQSLLKKAVDLDIQMICPLHGFVWRQELEVYLEKYQKWSTYTPEERGVLIAYASVYGNTANAAEILSCRLREEGIKTVMYDVSVTSASELVAEAFKYSHFVFASTTYNGGIFVKMQDFLHDLVAHNIQKRTVGFIQNGSWGIVCGKQMKELLASCKDMIYIEDALTVRSAVKTSQDEEINKLKNNIISSF